MPAFLNTVKQNMPGFGSPSCYGNIIGSALTATTALAINAASTTQGGTPTSSQGFNVNGGPPPSGGKWRLRTSSPAGTTITTVYVTATDGTTTVIVANLPGSIAGASIDYSGEFQTDLSLTNVTINVILAGATTTLTADAEVALV